MLIFKKYLKKWSIVVGFAAWIVALTMSQGCVGTAGLDKLRQSADPFHASPYPIALKRWTRESRIYQGLAVKLIVSATYESTDFRRAYADEYARAYHLNDSQHDKLKADQLLAAGTFHDFFIAAYVPEKGWDDFNKKDSTWKFYLAVNAGLKIEPVEIRKIDKIDAVTRHFFPYITPWKSIYRVRFPALRPETQQPLVPSGTAAVRLVITGVLGTAEMVWEGSIED